MKRANYTGTDAFLRSVGLPEKTKTYTPITHGNIIDKVSAELSNAGLIVEDTEYIYTDNGEIAVAKIHIRSTKDPDMGMLFSWANSYNKKVKFSCGIGAFIYENKSSFFGTEGLSWIRMHTGNADEEAFNIIEQIIDNAEEHFDNIISEKNRMKTQEMSIESYGRVMGALYFEHELMTTTQASSIDREYKDEKSLVTEKDTLWGLYKVIMYGIEGAAIGKWQQSQQKLHHLIMAEHAIATEPNTLADVNFDFLDNSLSNPVIGPGITPMGLRVVVEENKDGDPLVSAQAVMIDYSAEEQLADAMVAPLKSGNPLPLSTLSDNLPQKEDEEFDWKTEEEPEIRMVDPQTEEQKVAEYNETHDDSQMNVEYLSIKELEERYPDHLTDDQITAIEEGLDHNDPEIHIESDEEYAERVAIIEGEPEEIQDEMMEEAKLKLAEAVTEKIGDLIQEEIESHEGNAIPTIDDRQEWADKVLAEEPVGEHVGPPEMYIAGIDPVTSDKGSVGASILDVNTTTESFQEELDSLFPEDNEPSVKASAEVLNDAPVEIIAPKINLPEPVVAEVTTKAVIEVFEEIPEKKEDMSSPVELEEDPFAVDEPDFLEIEEHQGLETPTEILQEAAVIEKKMAQLFGSVKPYTVINTPKQINIILDETEECFFIPVE